MTVWHEGFIRRMDKYLDEHYPLHPTWRKLLSAATLASALTMDTCYVTNRGPNSCNLWIGYFAPSGDYKSTPIDVVTIPLLSELGRVQKRYVILPSIASTIEGLIKYFKRFEKNRSGVILRDELTTLFKEVGGKQYMTDEMEMYSMIYDGKIMPRETMRFESREIMKVYVNLIGATTPRYLYATMTESFFFQGCGNRFLYVRHELPTQNDNTVDDLFNKERKWRIEGLPAELKSFFDFLMKVSEAPYEILISDRDALETSVKFHNDRETLKSQIKDSDENAFKKEYLSRDWQKSLKLAQLSAISRKGLRPESLKTGKDGFRLIEIDLEDIEWGQKIVLDCYNHFETIVKEWKANVPTESKKILKNTRLLYQYLNVIREYGEIGSLKLGVVVGNATRNEEFYSILSTLVQVGCIKQITDSDYIRAKGATWLKENMISLKFKHAAIYKYVHGLE